MRLMESQMSIRILAVAAIMVAGCSKAAQVRPDTAPVAAAPAPRAVVADVVVDEPEVVEEYDRNRNATVAPPVVMFGFDSTELSATERERLAAWAGVVGEAGVAASALAVTIEGHCDERGTEEYNLVLGEKRASAVRTYLARMGLDASKLRTVSYGESRPAIQGSSEEAFAANRRAEVKVGVSAPKGASKKPIAGR